MSATKIGRQFVRFSSSTSATAVFLPAANANGAYIRTGSIIASAPSGNTNFVLVADTAAPTSVSDASKRAIFVANAPPGTLAPFQIPNELEVPAGWGVWAIADTTNWGVNITFDTLA